MSILKKSSSQDSGRFYIMATGGAVALTVLMVLTILTVVATQGLGYFWPAPLIRYDMQDGTALLAEYAGEDTVHTTGEKKVRIKVGNRDFYGQDFRWISADAIRQEGTPPDAIRLERVEFGDFHGYLKELRSSWGDAAGSGASDWERFEQALATAEDTRAHLHDAGGAVGDLGRRINGLDDDLLALAYAEKQDGVSRAAEMARVKEQAAAVRAIFDARNKEHVSATQAARKHTAVVRDEAGREKEIPLLEIIRAQRPNTMGVLAKAGAYLERVRELLFDEPRESNTEGGLFPAIFGTVMMVLLMSMFSLPLGVVTAIYLREYAREGLLVRMVRIAVYNLAGVPSIVFGVFGLGFFVYGVGGSLDGLFFAHRLPTPTFGTGGILWASLTLALLTVPVVIVATEEGLAAIPRGMREASLALGATKFQTVMRVVMPMAIPGILTGFILAMARAVGEVAPLMVTGVVKLAPSLPIDGTFPFIHLERKFMHLGFHIYDVGFQSPNVEAAKPMVFVTTLLLILIVLMLSISAIWLRNNMRRKFTTSAF